jgi:hypothetical protein
MPTRLNIYGQAISTTKKRPCIVATTTNIVLSGASTPTLIDGVNIGVDDRILVWQQNSPQDNGIYRLETSQLLSRDYDFNISDDLYAGIEVLVLSGLTYSGKTFYLTTLGDLTIGSSSLTFDILAGQNGTSGTSGGTGSSGASGSSGTSGTEGTSGSSGSSGTSGTEGTSGSSGTSGTEGTSGSSGTSGTEGTSGTSGLGSSGTSAFIVSSASTPSPVNLDSSCYWYDTTNKLPMVSYYGFGSNVFSWSAGGSLITARDRLAGAGTQNEGLAFGGYITYPPVSCTEEYNGTSWSAGGALITGRDYLAGAGTQNAGLAIGGVNPPVSCTEEYDGTSWSIGGVLINARLGLGGAGTQNEAFVVGGSFGNCTEEYNGTSWSAGGAIQFARFGISATGTQNVGLGIGGFSSVVVLSSTQEYNGTSWSAGGALITARYESAGGGTQNQSFVTAGFNGINLACTEEYNGTSWSAGGSLITARRALGGAGSQSAGLAFGGCTSTRVSCTEEYSNFGLINSTGVGVSYGTINYLPKYTGTTNLGNSIIYDDGTNVGIGTTSPTFKLDINASTTALNVGNSRNSVLALATLGKTVTSGYGTVDNYLQIGAGENAIGSTRLIGFGYSVTALANQPAYIGYIETANASNTKGALIFGTRDVETDTAPTERMRITSGGNVGIGETNPGARLYVKGSGVTSGTSALKVDNLSGTNLLNILDNGVATFRNISNSGAPSTSGTTVNATLSIDNAFSVMTNIGNLSVSPYSVWLQVQDKGNLAVTYPLSLQPNGGNVGIGTTSPTFPLTVETSKAGDWVSKIHNTDVTGLGLLVRTSAVNTNAAFGVYNGTSYVMYVRNDGNVGIGTTAPGQTLEVKGADGTGIRLMNAGSGDKRYDIVGSGNDLRINETGVGALLTIKAGGNVGIGTTSPSTKLEVVGTVTCTTLTETSTIRIKENIEEIINPLDIVKKLRGIQYNKIGNNNKEIGVIAEEVDEVLPQIVTRDTDGNPTSVSYGRLTALLIEVVKKQDEQIENLIKRIEQLEK